MQAISSTRCSDGEGAKRAIIAIARNLIIQVRRILLDGELSHLPVGRLLLIKPESLFDILDCLSGKRNPLWAKMMAEKIEPFFVMLVPFHFLILLSPLLVLRF